MLLHTSILANYLFIHIYLIQIKGENTKVTTAIELDKNTTFIYTTFISATSIESREHGVVAAILKRLFTQHESVI